MAELRVTAADFEERPGGLYWLGDLEAGKDVVKQDRFVFEGLRADGAYRVNLCDSENEDDLAEWGCSASGDPDEAWRYALGAAIGPYDFDEAEIVLTWEE